MPVKVSATGAIAGAGGGGNPSASALFYLRRLQTFDDKKRSTLDAMNYSTSVGLTTHLDQVLFPTPGPLHPSQILSNLDQYRMYDSWIALHKEGKATVRLQMNFLQNQNDPALPGIERASPQSVPVLRRRHADDRIDRRMGRTTGQRRGLARGPASGGAGRLAQREQRSESRRTAAGCRSLRSGEQGIRYHETALDGAPRSRTSMRICSADCRRWDAASRWRRFDG